MANSSVLHFSGGTGRERRLFLPELTPNDLGSNAEVASILPRIAQRRESAERAQAMLDITRYAFHLYRVSKHTFSDPANDHVFGMLWGVKEIVNPEEPIKYLRPTDPIDLRNDPMARESVSKVVHEDSIELIASTPDVRPWIEHLGLLAQGQPNMYNISA